MNYTITFLHECIVRVQEDMLCTMWGATWGSFCSSRAENIMAVASVPTLTLLTSVIK